MLEAFQPELTGGPLTAQSMQRCMEIQSIIPQVMRVVTGTSSADYESLSASVTNLCASQAQEPRHSRRSCSVSLRHILNCSKAYCCTAGARVGRGARGRKGRWTAVPRPSPSTSQQLGLLLAPNKHPSIGQVPATGRQRLLEGSKGERKVRVDLLHLAVRRAPAAARADSGSHSLPASPANRA